MIKFKKSVSLLLAVLFMLSCLTPMSFAADEYTSGIFTYSIESGKVVIISVPETTEGSVSVPKTIAEKNVVAIGTSAFAGCTLIESVSLPETVTEIRNNAFSLCVSLSQINLPIGIKKIGDNAFFDCGSLETVTYKGSASDKSKISIGKNNDDLLNAKWNSEDTSKLTLLSVSPKNGSDEVLSNDSLVLTFNQPIAPEFDFPVLDKSEIAIYDSDTDEKVYSLSDDFYTFVTEFDENKVTIKNPFKNLSIGRHYYLFISPDVIKAKSDETIKFEGITNPFQLVFSLSESIRVMSYNLYSPNGKRTNVSKKTYDFSYSTRAQYLAQNIIGYSPDSFGVHVITKEMKVEIDNVKTLNGKTISSEYNSVGEYRGVDGSSANEGSLIYYKRNKFELLKTETLWLTDKDGVCAKHSKANYLRVFTYAILKNKETNNVYIHVNTHIDHNNEAALFSAKMITNYIQSNYPGVPAVVTGDFNQTSGSDTYKYFINHGFSDARSDYSGSLVTYHNWFKMGEGSTAYTSKVIDHIMFNNGFNIISESYKVCNDDYTNEKYYGDYVLDYPYPSDHHPIISDFKIANQTDNYIYNITEETYKFYNFGDDDSEYGHCFGMSLTSSGYYLNILDASSIGLKYVQDLYDAELDDKVKEPICKYQAEQGYNLISSAIVAGGNWYLNDIATPQDDFDAIVDYVKNNRFNNKGSLAISFWATDGENTAGHTVNFLYYKKVDGENRVYIYDNNFPDAECYFSQDTKSGKIIEFPESTFNSEFTVCGMHLLNVETFFENESSFDYADVIYSESGEILIDGVKGAPMTAKKDNKMMYCYEIPSEMKNVKITPLVDNAEYTYCGKKYKFGKIDEDTYGIFTLSENEETASEFARLRIKNAPVNSLITNCKNITVDFKSSVTLHAQCDAEGVSIAWFDAKTGKKLKDGNEYKVDLATESFSVYVAAVENGAKVDGTESETETVTVKSGFFDILIAFFRGLFKSLPVWVDNNKQ